MDRDIQQNNVQIVVIPNFTPTFNWTPHLTPEDDFVIDQHVFRNPAMIVQDESKSLTLLMDVASYVNGYCNYKTVAKLIPARISH